MKTRQGGRRYGMALQQAAGTGRKVRLPWTSLSDSALHALYQAATRRTEELSPPAALHGGATPPALQSSYATARHTL